MNKKKWQKLQTKKRLIVGYVTNEMKNILRKTEKSVTKKHKFSNLVNLSSNLFSEEN